MAGAGAFSTKIKIAVKNTPTQATIPRLVQIFIPASTDFLAIIYIIGEATALITANNVANGFTAPFPAPLEISGKNIIKNPPIAAIIIPRNDLRGTCSFANITDNSINIIGELMPTKDG